VERAQSRGVVGIMRHGLTMAPAGLLLVLVLSGAGPDPPAGEVRVPDERFGSRTAPILLLSRPDVQTDLHLDAWQIAAAKREIARLIEKALSLKDKKGQAIQGERLRIDNEMVRWLTATLSAPQRERLLQVNLQWEGAAALTRPHVVTHLNLSEPQCVAIKRLVTQLEETRRARGMLKPVEIGRFTAQAQAVLSPGQKEDWDSLLGPPCRFSIGGQAVMTGNPEDPQVIKTRARPVR
jgi:hypothetical protein